MKGILSGLRNTEKVLIFLFVFALQLGFLYFVQKIIPGDLVWLVIIALIIAILSFFVIILIDKSNADTFVSDSKILSDKKKNYLSEILQNLQISVDEKLKIQLQRGELEKATQEIEYKIDAINRLIEIVTKGDDPKSLNGTDISSVSDFYESTTGRLNNEMRRQYGNSFLALSLGLVFSLITIYILFSSFFKDGISIPLTLENLIPRISLSLIVQFLAYYFLNIYRKAQEEIRFWKNEKTNLDLKIFAIGMANEDGEIGTPDFMKEIVKDLINTERNNILKKEDTTIELEKAKVEGNSFEAFLNKFMQLTDILKTKKE